MASARLASVLRSGAATVFLSLALCHPAAANVKLARKPATVEHRSFDPKHPPATMPHLDYDVVAVCNCKFGVGIQLSLSTTPPDRVNGTYKVTTTINSVEIEPTLNIDVWVPAGGSDKLKAHEEGHRQIAEKIYTEVADRAAKAAAAKIDGRRFDGEGETRQQAVDAALKEITAAQTAAIQSYLDQTSKVGQKTQDEYDALTAHGTNGVAEPDAVKRAWEKYPPPLWVAPKQPATKPATRRGT